MNTNHVTQVVASYAHDADDLRLLLDADRRARTTRLTTGRSL